MSPRPRILFVASHCPFGPAYGARIRTFNIGKLLQRHGDVALALVGPDPISPEELDLTQKHFDLKAIMPLRATRPTAWNAIKKEIDPRFHAVRGQRLSP